MLKGFKTHTGNPIGTTLLETGRTLATRNKDSWGMGLNEIAGRFERERTLAVLSQTPSIIGYLRIKTSHKMVYG